MIVEFIIGLIIVWTFTYFILKLVDQWKIKKIKKQYPDGTETKSVAVTRLDQVPHPFPEKPKEISSAMNVLKTPPKQFPKASKEDLKEDK